MRCWHCHRTGKTHTQQTGKTTKLLRQVTHSGHFSVLALFFQGSYSPFPRDAGGSAEWPFGLMGSFTFFPSIQVQERITHPF